MSDPPEERAGVRPEATIEFADSVTPTPNICLTGCATAIGTRFQ